MKTICFYYIKCSIYLCCIRDIFKIVYNKYTFDIHYIYIEKIDMYIKNKNSCVTPVTRITHT